MGKNVANRESYPFAAPGTAYSTEPSLRWLLHRGGLATVKVENEGREEYNPPVSGNDLVFKFQDSADGVTWADIAGATDTVKPMGAAQLSLTLNPLRPYLQLLAYGDAKGMAEMTFDVSPSPGLLAS